MKSRGLDSIHSWCIAVACSLLVFLLATPMKMNGLFFVAMLERFDISRKQASVPFSTVLIVRCLSGPVTASLGKVIGLRNLVFLGSSLATVGLFICFFAEEITTLVAAYGVVYGLGVSFGISLLPQVIKQHFERNLIFALAINLSVFNIVVMIFYPIVKSIIQKYGFSGALLIISGIMINALPISLTLKEPKYKTATPNPEETGENVNIQESTVSPDIRLSKDTECKSSNVKTDTDRDSSSLFHQKRDKNLIPEKTTKAILPNGEPEHLELQSPHTTTDASEEKHLCTAGSISPPIEHQHDIYQKAPMENSSVKNITIQVKPNLTWKSKIASIPHSLQVFGDPRYINIMLFESCFLFSVQLLLTIVLDASRDKGIPRTLEVHFLAFHPFCELCGCLALGWMTNKNFITKINLAAGSFLGLAVVCQVFVWAQDFATLMTGIAVEAFFGAGYSVAISNLVFDYTEDSQQSMALTCRQVLYLPLGLTMPYLIGYFRESLGSYNGIFHLLTAMSLFGFGLVKLLPCIARFRLRKKM